MGWVIIILSLILAFIAETPFTDFVFAGLFIGGCILVIGDRKK